MIVMEETKKKNRITKYVIIVAICLLLAVGGFVLLNIYRNNSEGIGQAFEQMEQAGQIQPDQQKQQASDIGSESEQAGSNNATPDNAGDKTYIGEEKAKEIALAHAEVSGQDVFLIKWKWIWISAKWFMK